jgi:hypothetical protein
LERELAELQVHVTSLQTALDFWMPSIASEESPDGERAAQDAILVLGLDKVASDCYGDRICTEIEALRKDKERLDSGVMVYITFDVFGERVKVESRENDSRATIDKGHRAVRPGRCYGKQARCDAISRYQPRDLRPRPFERRLAMPSHIQARLPHSSRHYENRTYV